jgi:hypothetical protein
MTEGPYSREIALETFEFELRRKFEPEFDVCVALSVAGYMTVTLRTGMYGLRACPEVLVREVPLTWWDHLKVSFARGNSFERWVARRLSPPRHRILEFTVSGRAMFPDILVDLERRHHVVRVYDEPAFRVFPPE